MILLSAGPGEALALDPWWGLALGLFFVALNGFFVAAEFALVKVRATQIDPHVAAGKRHAKVARHMITHLDRYLSATQLGITLASLALGWIGEPAFAWLIEPLIERIPGAGPGLVHSVALIVAFTVISILHIVVGELAPKSLAIRRPEPTTLWTAIPLYWFYWAASPAIWVLNHAANFLLRLVGIEPVGESELAHDEEELRRLLSSAGSRLPEEKRKLLDNIFGLSDRVARQIMVPRADVVFLSTEGSVEDNLTLARESGHTRFPLCEGDLDQVIGLIHIKDLFRAVEPPEALTDIARKISFVPETLDVDRLLRRMRGERLHMAAVLDEYGGVSGIVMLENVIEEIVGQIQDEFDSERPEIIQRGEREWMVAGGMLVDELEQALGLELSERNEDTIGGVVLSEIGRRPVLSDRVTLGPAQIEVMEVQGNRVTRVHLTVEPEPPPEEGA